MIKKSEKSYQVNFMEADLLDQLDKKHPLLALAENIPWEYLEEEFRSLYSTTGRSAKSIRLMSGLLILKQMNNLSDQSTVENWIENPYWQVFCGMRKFQFKFPCDSSDLTYFRKRLGEEGVEKIFAVSVSLFGKKAKAKKVIIDTTVQEKNITYPTDSKIRIKIINRLQKLAKKNRIRLRRTFTREIKQLRLDLRFFRHPKKRKKATKATKRLKTIAGVLIRELTRKLPEGVLQEQQENFELFERILNQKRGTKNKVYSLHEPEAYCIAKGKDHKPYEYGSKASVVSTFKDNIIIGATSHSKNVHDSKTLDRVLEQVKRIQNNYQPETALCDRGYRGKSESEGVEIMIPKAPLKRDSRYQKRKKGAYFRRRAAIEPIIGHLKSDYRLSRNYLKGNLGDEINIMMAACAFNMKKWMRWYASLLLFFFIYVSERRKKADLKSIPAV